MEWRTGKYPVKVYTIDGVLIYQHNIGDDNTGKTPLGGVIYQSSPASSMLTTIANPIIFYYGSGNPVISQVGHSGDLYDYYWTSYSRGIDGRTNWDINESKWHNVYLDGYIPLRVKSIYDPCPYSYRIPSNGTWNNFNMQSGWTTYSYLGGVSWNLETLGENWFAGLGLRTGSGTFEVIARDGHFHVSTSSDKIYGYSFSFNSTERIYTNRDNLYRSSGLSVRCIEVVTFVTIMNRCCTIFVTLF